MRISALGNTATDFASDDYIVIDGTTNGSRKMAKSTLLSKTAEDAINSGKVLANVGATQASYNEKVVKDFVTTNGDGTQNNINMFEQIISIPSSPNQWFNKDGCIKFNAYLNGATLAAGANFKTAMIRLAPNKTYCVSLPNGSFNRFGAAVATHYYAIGNSDARALSGVTTGDTRTYYKFTTSRTESYLLVYYYVKTLDGDDDTIICDKIVVNEGETPEAYSAYGIKSLAFNDEPNESLEIEELQKRVWSKMVDAICRNSPFIIESDVTTSYDMDETPNKYIDSSGTMVNNASFNISQAIQVDYQKVYAVRSRCSISGSIYASFYSDKEGSQYIGGQTFEADRLKYCNMAIVNPVKGAKSFRLCWWKDTGIGLYEITYNYNLLSANITDKINSVLSSATIAIDADITSSITFNSLKRINPDNGLLVSSSSGSVSDPILIDWKKLYSIDATYDQYRYAVAYYKDEDGLVFDSFQYDLPIAGSIVLTNAILNIPPTAKSFRICSNNNTLNLYNVHYTFGTATDAEITRIEDDIASLQEDVANLLESSFLSSVIETVTAVKYKQNQTLYLGSNLFDFSELNYNPSVWSVDSVNGTISYLGGTIDPIIMEVSTDNDNSYLFECVTSDYQQQTEMFRVAIGDGYKNDPYNGTDNISVGAMSDGGYLKIYPKLTTNTFTLSSIEFRKKVSLGEADKTELYEGRNVNSGNSDGSILDGKWNVAVGPTAYTQNKAVGLSRSIAIGYQAQALLNSGLQNIAIGTFAQNLLKYAERNVAIGSDCLYAVTFADDCIAIGKAAISGNASQVSWNNSATWQYLKQIVAIGNDAARIANGQTASKSVLIGYSCAADGIGDKCTAVGADIRNQYGKTNCTAIGYAARCDKSNQSVIGNPDTAETKVYGDLIVEGTDSVKRRIVFNNDNTCSWEAVTP